MGLYRRPLFGSVILWICGFISVIVILNVIIWKFKRKICKYTASQSRHKHWIRASCRGTYFPKNHSPGRPLSWQSFLDMPVICAQFFLLIFSLFPLFIILSSLNNHQFSLSSLIILSFNISPSPPLSSFSLFFFLSPLFSSFPLVFFFSLSFLYPFLFFPPFQIFLFPPPRGRNRIGKNIPLASYLIFFYLCPTYCLINSGGCYL